MLGIIVAFLIGGGAGWAINTEFSPQADAWPPAREYHYEADAKKETKETK